MSNNGLIIAGYDPSQLPSTQIGNDADYADLAKGADFLGRLQLFGKGKAIDKGLIKPGHYGIPDGEEVIDLGSEIDLIPFARRPKAVDMTDKDNLIVSYDNTTDEFKRIAAASGEKDSGCMYGVSFLVWERSTGKFYELFCGTKSMRSEAKKIFPFLPLSAADIQARDLQGEEPHGPLPFKAKSKLIEGRYSYWVPVVVKSSTPFSVLPTGEQIVAEVTKFVNPSAEGPTKVQEPGGKKRRAR